MPSINPERRGVNYQEVLATSLDQMRAMATQQLSQEVEARMNAAVSEMLQRAPYGRRAEVPGWMEIEGAYQRRGSRQSQRVSRDGGRERGILMLWGWVMIWVQRLVCECGGTVYDWHVRPGCDLISALERIVDAQIRCWGRCV